MCSAARLLKERGALRIYCGGTHGVFAGPAVERLSEAPIDEVVVTNSIPLNGQAQNLDAIKVLSIASMLGETIKRIHRNESVSALFGMD
jgi:ribose-phosphate pyrophosphokinase